jgi:hypothetical protein
MTWFMTWFSNILGSGNSQGYINPAATPSGLMSSTSTSSSLSALQGGSITAISNQGYWAAQQGSLSGLAHESKVYAIKAYADAIGWALEHYRLPEGTTSNDPKIAILKISTIGEVIKDVGVRTSETDFYIMRQPGE